MRRVAQNLPNGQKFPPPQRRCPFDVFTPHFTGRVLLCAVRRRLASAALLAALIAASPGCVAYHNGRSIGTGWADSLASVVGVPSSGCGCDNTSCSHVVEPVPSWGHGFVALDESDPLHGHVPVHHAYAGESGDGSYAAASSHHPPRSRLRALAALPRDAFAAAANFCIRPIAFAPADVPPPGRFHPVPTRPAFAPR